MLIKQESLQNYFHNYLHKSLHKHKVHATDYTIIYLANLLNRFSRSENFVDKYEGRSPHKPLALHYADAINSNNSHERNLALRRLGDLALFVCGFFSDNLKTKTVDVDYYIAMGGSAYSHLSECSATGACNTTLKEVFYELSHYFIEFVDVLSDLNETQLDKNVLRTYEIWLRTGSKRAKNMLLDNGISPIPNPTHTIYQ